MSVHAFSGVGVSKRGIGYRYNKAPGQHVPVSPKQPMRFPSHYVPHFGGRSTPGSDDRPEERLLDDHDLRAEVELEIAGAPRNPCCRNGLGTVSDDEPCSLSDSV